MPRDAQRPSDDRAYRRRVRAWCLYDWGNSAFATTVMVTLYPPFFRGVAQAAGLSSSEATAAWGYTTALALLLVACSAPVLGAIADAGRTRKRHMAAFTAMGVLATAGFLLVGSRTWVLAAVLFVLANVGFAGAAVFYDAFLPRIARPGDLDRVSSLGFAYGYLGGGLLLVLNALWVTRPHWFGMSDTTTAVRVSFASVAVWWSVFSVPFFRTVRESREGAPAPRSAFRALADGVRRLRQTFGHVRRYRQVALFLAAYWVYNDGVGTIGKMATAYGDELGIGVRDMILALVVTQFVSFPTTLLAGRLAGRIGPKHTLLFVLAVYTGISIAAFFMRTAAHFYVLAILVGTVQGGSQAMSRSIFGSMVPRAREAEFFGFYSTAGKFAGILGPLLFAVVSHAAGSSRLSILSLVVFFVVGAVLLTRVDVEAGRQAAARA